MTNPPAPGAGPDDGPDDGPDADRPLIRTQADLEQAWRGLMAPLGFTRSSLWMMLVGPDDVALPQLVEIDDCHRAPDPDLLAGFGDLARAVRDEHCPGGRWALLLSRPGGAEVTAHDRAWARGLVEACRAAGVGTEVVHLATDVDVLPLPWDELAGAA